MDAAMENERKREAALQEALRRAAPAQALAGPPEAFDGPLNIYTCDKCFGHIVTRDTVPGTTPFMLACEATDGCEGMMKSSFYRVFDPTMKASHVWYLPIITPLMPPAVLAHVEKGGLMLRKVRPQ